MSDFKVNTITNRDGSYGPQVCGITTFGGSGMQLPSGPTEFRGGRGRGIIAGGRNNPDSAAAQVTIDMHEISTTGNAVDFGDLMEANTGAKGGGCTGSATRAIFTGGFNPGPSALTTQIQYVVMSSGGGANDWGDLETAKNGITPASNNTRGILQGGATPDYTSEMSSINIQSLGNDSNFGSHLEGAIRNGAAAQNGTRGLWGGGQGPSANYFTIVSYVFATSGSGTKFGELSDDPNANAAVSSGIRGVWAGGAAPSVTNTIEYVTIATEGNATDFGDLTTARRNLAGCTNRIRGTFAGGHTQGSGSGDNLNTIDFITIASTGDATDFGDLTVVRRCSNAGGSDAHGGLIQ